jgi:hypothetical protein
LFYFNIMSYTAYENGKEMLFIPLLKENKWNKTFFGTTRMTAALKNMAWLHNIIILT